MMTFFNGLLPQVLIGFKYFPITKKVHFTSCFLILQELFTAFWLPPSSKVRQIRVLSLKDLMGYMNSGAVSAGSRGRANRNRPGRRNLCNFWFRGGFCSRAGSEDGVCVTGKVGWKSHIKQTRGDGNGVTSGVGVGSAETLCAALESGSNSGSVYSAGEDEGPNGYHKIQPYRIPKR